MIKVCLLVFDLTLLKVLIVDHLVVMLFAFVTLPSESTGALIRIGTLYPGCVEGFILCNNCRQSNLWATLHLSENGSISSSCSTLKQQHIPLIACHEINRVDLAPLIEGHEYHVRSYLFQGGAPALTFVSTSSDHVLIEEF